MGLVSGANGVRVVRIESVLTAGKALGPLLFADLAVLVIPETLEHIGVVQ